MPRKPRDGEIDREIAGAGDIPIRRIGKYKSSYERADGTVVEGHTQRYWYGSKVSKEVPHHNVFAEGVEENERIRQARRQYYATSTLGQRLWDNEEYATIDIKGKLQPGIFGRDDKGNPIPIEDWQWELWQSRPNQYDIYRVDDPIPDQWYVKSNADEYDGRKSEQRIRFEMYDKETRDEMGHITLKISREREYVYDSEAGEWRYKWQPVGSPSLTVEPQYEGRGIATYLIREAIDFADEHNVKASISASPTPYGLEKGVLKKGTQVVHFEESDEGFANRIAFTKAAMKDMYMSFGLTGGPSREEIYRDPEQTFSMSRDPYSEISQEILRKRQVKKPDTAEYTEKKTQAAKKRKKRQRRTLMAVRE